MLTNRIAGDVRTIALEIANQLIEIILILNVGGSNLLKQSNGILQTAMPKKGHKLGEKLIAEVASLQAHTEILFTTFVQMIPIKNEVEGLEPSEGFTNR